MSVVSPTADISLCQSIRYMKDHMSGVVGRSHCISTIGGTGLVSLELRGGPGQTVSESEGSCLRAQTLAWFVQCAASISCSI